LQSIYLQRSFLWCNLSLRSLVRCMSECYHFLKEYWGGHRPSCPRHLDCVIGEPHHCRHSNPLFLPLLSEAFEVERLVCPLAYFAFPLSWVLLMQAAFRVMILRTVNASLFILACICQMFILLTLHALSHSAFCIIVFCYFYVWFMYYVQLNQSVHCLCAVHSHDYLDVLLLVTIPHEPCYLVYLQFEVHDSACLFHHPRPFLLHILWHALNLDAVHYHLRALVAQYCRSRHVFDPEIIRFQNPLVVLIANSEDHHSLESSYSLYVFSCCQRADCVWAACQCHYLRCAHLVHSFHLSIPFDPRHYFHLPTWFALWRRLSGGLPFRPLRDDRWAPCYFGPGVCPLSVFPISIYFFQPIGRFLQSFHQRVDVVSPRRRDAFASPLRQLLDQDEQLAQLHHWNHSGRVFLLQFIEST